MKFHSQYWDNKYSSKQTGWDIGYVSTPLKEYFDKLKDKSIKILIPGAGKGWEAEYLYRNGFVNTFILDFSIEAVEEFKTRCHWFPENQVIIQDFFKHTNQYDLIVEQTFFSSLDTFHREKYASSMHSKLAENGSLVGLLFNHWFPFEGPPFGGDLEEYTKLFEPWFNFNIFETTTNSIKPRKGREFFIRFTRKNS